MDPGTLVVLSAHSPREKFWGVLLRLDATGVTLRGLAMDSFEDWLRQFLSGAAPQLAPVTLFLPLHRVDRIEVDERAGAVEGIGERFQRLTGKDPRKAVAGGLQEEEGRRQR